jgi:hypothetical protein
MAECLQATAHGADGSTERGEWDRERERVREQFPFSDEINPVNSCNIIEFGTSSVAFS